MDAPAPSRSPLAPAPQQTATIALFLRALAVVYAIAFASLAVQVEGLIGSRGILPVGSWLEALRGTVGWSELPTLLWLSSSDATLLALAWGGAAAAVAAAVGWARGPLLAVSFAFYLSLAHGGQDFLSFQWDALLLEAGFLALFVAPYGWRRKTIVPSRLGVWLLRLLLFKLMFSSGVTKLTWNDPTWWDLTALDFHYWTQPLPTPLAWWAARLPGGVQKASCVAMFAIEIGAPFAAFGPRRARLVAAASLVSLQALIAASGNYGFFNLLSVVLIIPLLDDAALASIKRRLRRPTASPDREAAPPGRLRTSLTAAMAAATAVLSLSSIGEALRWSPGPDSALVAVRRAASPWMIHSGYGLFRVMTTTRPEIEIELSADGSSWRPVVFPAKPGPLDRAPPWVAPHMPRLDWQMWFAALSAERLLELTGGRPSPRHLPPWLLAFVRALVDRQPAVLGLVEGEASQPRPRWVRMTLYRYRFSDGADAWWRREPAGVLLPAVRLDG